MSRNQCISVYLESLWKITEKNSFPQFSNNWKKSIYCRELFYRIRKKPHFHTSKYIKSFMNKYIPPSFTSSIMIQFILSCSHNVLSHTCNCNIWHLVRFLTGFIFCLNYCFILQLNWYIWCNRFIITDNNKQNQVLHERHCFSFRYEKSVSNSER